MIAALILVPTIAGLLALVLRWDAPRRAILALTAFAHLGMTAACWNVRPASTLGGWLQLDGIGLLFLGTTSVLFVAAAVYGVGYLGREGHGSRKDLETGFVFANAPEATFTGCLLLFLAAMTLVCCCQRFGLLWVAVEATTLASAPLIYFHRHPRSLEATWKYLLLCSVGIALALLGVFFLAVSATDTMGHQADLSLRDLLKHAKDLDPAWLKAAFIFLVVGYGTKMGLAPLHTWLPDAHSESPSMVSALLSGALLNCAFIGILRMQQVLVAAGLASFGQEILVVLGLLSMGVAAVFILGQPDYKRMLAYSSVEHMGILALGVGLGGVGTFGSLLHAVNHSFTKGMLFLVAGNLLATYHSKACDDVRGAIRVLPVSGVLWVMGFLAITGSPPFGPFLSEFTILKAALDAGRGVVAAAYLVFLALIFIGMATAVLRMAQGAAPAEFHLGARSEPALSIASPAALATIVLVLGLWIPQRLLDALHEAARSMGGSP
ncbi:MAG: proton-conducting transporter membrane subunit [Planctomycetota bacterium]